MRAIGPGSQPAEDDELQYLAMPRDMATFAMPRVPEARRRPMRSPRRATCSRPSSPRTERWDPASGASGPRLDLAGVPEATLAIVNEMLGEGEVSIQVGGRARYRIQESVFTGVWRVCALDGDGRLASDGSKPRRCRDVASAARARGRRGAHRARRDPARGDELARAAGRDRRADSRNAATARPRTC